MLNTFGMVALLLTRKWDCKWEIVSVSGNEKHCLCSEVSLVPSSVGSACFLNQAGGKKRLFLVSGYQSPHVQLLNWFQEVGERPHSPSRWDCEVLRSCLMS